VRLIQEAADRPRWLTRRAAARAAYEAEHLPSVAAEHLLAALENVAVAKAS
jgi:hypothetical protein